MNIKPLALSVLCVVCLVSHATSQTTDTVRSYDRASVRAYYDARTLVRQVQRFRLAAGTAISSIGLMVRGEPRKAAGSIVIYGHEGGLVAPRLGKELYRTTFSKQHFGNEEVHVTLDPAFTHAGGQLFVSFEGLASGIDVLTDTRTRLAPCTEAWGEGRYDQMQLDTTCAACSAGTIGDASPKGPSGCNNHCTEDLMQEYKRLVNLRLKRLYDN